MNPKLIHKRAWCALRGHQYDSTHKCVHCGKEMPNKYKSFREEFEKCIICKKETDIRVDEHIFNRNNYVEGCGQCCVACYLKIYDKPKKKEVMEIL